MSSFPLTENEIEKLTHQLFIIQTAPKKYICAVEGKAAQDTTTENPLVYFIEM